MVPMGRYTPKSIVDQGLSQITHNKYERIWLNIAWARRTYVLNTPPKGVFTPQIGADRPIYPQINSRPGFITGNPHNKYESI